MVCRWRRGGSLLRAVRGGGVRESVLTANQLVQSGCGSREWIYVRVVLSAGCDQTVIGAGELCLSRSLRVPTATSMAGGISPHQEWQLRGPAADICQLTGAAPVST